MAKYRKRPVEINAIRYTGDNRDEVAAFMGRVGRVEDAHLPGPGRGLHAGIVIRTLEGDMTASPGDWVVRGVQGEYYPVKPNIFAETYEEVPCGDAPVG